MLRLFGNDNKNRDALTSYARGLAVDWKGESRDKTLSFIKDTLSEHHALVQKSRGGSHGKFVCVDNTCKFNVAYNKKDRANVYGIYTINCDDSLFQPYHDILCTSPLNSKSISSNDLVNNVKFKTWVTSKSAHSTKDLINSLRDEGITATVNIVKKAKSAISAESHSKMIVGHDFKTLPAFLNVAKDLNPSMESDIKRSNTTVDDLSDGSDDDKPISAKLKRMRKV
jgi:hypothetical protein